MWTDPNSFRPRKTSRDITEAAARSFATLAEQLRGRGHHPDTVAHFLTQCLFCFFAEDVGLLPGRMFERLVNNRQITSERLTAGLDSLFATMRDGGLYGPDDIPWFNGGLFKRIEVPKLEILDITELRNAAGLNWSAIDVSIFGTLFERGLDPAKRSQLGAHYTDPATIHRMIGPVIRAPFATKWEQVAEVDALSGSWPKAPSKKATSTTALRRPPFMCAGWTPEGLPRARPRLRQRQLSVPGAQGAQGHRAPQPPRRRRPGAGPRADLVTGPHNVLGIELNEYAAELARVTVWIGELQWRLAHGYPFKTNPVLEPLDHIECRDALLAFPVLATPGDGSVARAGQTPGAHTLRFLKSPPTSAPPTPRSETAEQEMGSDPDCAQQHSGSDPLSCGPSEASWPTANVVIGNPPFLGDKKMRAELGDAYTEALRKTYERRVPGGADLVCYWFEKARAQIEAGALGAAGLVATNSIRGGKNRVVLDAICRTTRIFEAWSDEAWVNEGAAVRVSLVAFGDAARGATLDGQGVSAIHADLTAGAAADSATSQDVTSAVPLRANRAAGFIGGMKKGPFDVIGEVARGWLRLPNPNEKSNADVVKKWFNGLDVTRRPQDQWIVDFGIDMPENEAALYEAPFAHVLRAVRPQRLAVRNELEKARWWLHARPAPDLRRATSALPRMAATARVAKHRLFVWLSPCVVADGQLVVVARADDTTFGILHSRFHELWSLRMGTSLEDRPRYTPTTCFETFAFPAGLTPLDTAHQRTETLESGAVIPEIRGQSPISPDSLPTGDQGVAANSGSDPESPAAGDIPGADTLRRTASAIAIAAHRLNALREAWLNPPEWTQRVPEVVPLGLAASPYPDRIEPRPGLSEADLQALKKRTLTNLYNLRPAWLAMAHQQLDAAVAAAYGWGDYTPAMPDEEILRRLLALNRQRSATIAQE
jgi:hypothetical protein